ncbi:MAG: hypothetical protein AAGA56_08960 [Myxococcota bacterium]
MQSTSRRSLLTLLAVGSGVGFAPSTSSGRGLPSLYVDVRDRAEDGRRLMRFRVPSGASQALWAGEGARMRLRWEVHLPPDEKEEKGKEKEEDDEEKAKDDGESTEKGQPPPAFERLVLLGAWPIVRAAALDAALSAARTTPKPRPPVRPTRRPLLKKKLVEPYLGLTFGLHRAGAKLDLGTLRVALPFVRALARRGGDHVWWSWSTAAGPLTTTPLGYREAFERLPR